MSNYYTGETIEEATKKGLAELNLNKEDVEILVIDAPSKGFLGFGKKDARIQIIKKAKEEVTEVQPKEILKQEKQVQKQETKEFKKEVKEFKKEVKQAEKQEKKETKELEKANEEKLEETPLTPIENPSADALTTKTFLTGLFEKINLKATVEVVLENEENVIFNILTDDSSFVIGYRGEVLDSIQTLAGAVYNTNKEKYLRVVDCENYRTKREKTLISLAKKLAIKAKKTGRKVTLEPMNPFERRVIHSALMNEEGVTTVSEGKEPNRFVAVIPDGYDASKDRRRFNGNRRGGKPQGRRDYNNGNREKRDFSSKPTEQKKPRTTFGSGVFLGNSLKDNKEE